MDPISTIASIISVINEIVKISDQIKKNRQDVEALMDRLQTINVFLAGVSTSSQATEAQVLALDKLTRLLDGSDGLNRFINKVNSKPASFTSAIKRIVYKDKVSERISGFNSDLDRSIAELTLMFVVSTNTMLVDETQFVKDPEPAVGAESDDNESVLGEGSFGIVYRMRSKNDRSLYAVKVVNVRKLNSANVNIEHLQEEIRLLCKLTHPNITRYFSSFFSKNKRYFNLVMELAEGGTLAGQVKNKAVTEQLISKWMQEGFSALAYMHDEHHILHRDIKPENLLLDGRSCLKIADVGLACVVNSHSFANSKVGSAHYMSYEKANSIRYDGRDDVWAMGCVLAELLTEKRLAEWGGALYMFGSNEEVRVRRQNVLKAARAKSSKLADAASTLLEQFDKRPTASDARVLVGGAKNEYGNLKPSAVAAPALPAAAKLVPVVPAPAPSVATKPVVQAPEKAAPIAAPAAAKAEVKPPTAPTPAPVVAPKPAAAPAVTPAVPAATTKTTDPAAPAAVVDYAQSKVLGEHDGTVTAFGYSWDGIVPRMPCIVSASEDCTLKFWDVAAGFQHKSLKGHTGAVNALVRIFDGRIVSGSSDKDIRVWSTPSNTCGENLLTGHSAAVLCLASLVVVGIGNIVSGSADGRMRIWGVYDKDFLQHDIDLKIGAIRAMTEIPYAFMKKELLVLCGSVDDAVRVFEFRLTVPSEHKKISTGHVGLINALAASPDGRIISAGADCSVRICSYTTGALERVLTGHTKSVRSLGVLSGTRVVSGADDCTIRLWDMQTGVCFRTLQGHTGPVTALLVLKDDSIASGSADKTVRKWG